MSFLYLQAIVTIVATVRYFLMDYLLRQYSHLLHDVNLAGSRRSFAINAAFMSYELVLANLQLMQADRVAGTRRVLLDAAQQLEVRNIGIDFLFMFS